MAEILDVVDLEALRKEVREKYREVAEDPTAEYHFHTGRPHAIRLGYPATPLDQLPDYACEAFAGVGNPFFWGRYGLLLGSALGGRRRKGDWSRYDSGNAGP